MSENAFSLILSVPGHEPTRHDLTGEEITFGRSPENTIQILVAEVSVKHGRFLREGGGYRIVDSGSTNGTKANGAAVDTDGTVLSPMDRILLGTVVPAYFVPAAVLATTTPADLFNSLEERATAANPKTAPVAVALPARAAIPVALTPAATAGGATVKLDQIQTPGVAPVPVRQPLPGAPTAVPAKPAPGVPPQAPGAVPLKAPAAAPVRPAVAAPAAPGGIKPPVAAPAAPGGIKPPVAAPTAPGAPAAPSGLPVPLKKPAPTGVPAAPSIPLPKKPGQ